MPEYMLDTDTVSFALRGQGRVGSRLLEHRPSQLCISSISVAELRFGAETRRSRRLHRLISTFIDSMEVVAFDEKAADRFAAVATSLARGGSPIGTFDTLNSWTAEQQAWADRLRQPLSLGVRSDK